MKVSLAAVRGLDFVYKDYKIDYNKYGSIKLNAEPIYKYIYILANVSMLLISNIMFEYLVRLGYV